MKEAKKRLIDYMVEKGFILTGSNTKELTFKTMGCSKGKKKRK